MRTEFEFVLPRGYVDESGTVHNRGTMRLATARDELQPLRDPTVTGPDDPRLTLLVLVRVIESLGTLQMVTMHEIEGLFAADLAYLQDFYGVINFGSDADIDALLAAQAGMAAATPVPASPPPPPAAAAPAAAEESEEVDEADESAEVKPRANASRPARPIESRSPNRRSSVEEVPSSPAASRPSNRRAAIEEVPSGNR